MPPLSPSQHPPNHAGPCFFSLPMPPPSSSQHSPNHAGPGPCFFFPFDGSLHVLDCFNIGDRESMLKKFESEHPLLKLCLQGAGSDCAEVPVTEVTKMPPHIALKCLLITKMPPRYPTGRCVLGDLECVCRVFIFKDTGVQPHLSVGLSHVSIVNNSASAPLTRADLTPQPLSTTRAGPRADNRSTVESHTHILMCYHLQDIYLFISGLSAQAQDCLQAPTAGARHNVNHRRRPRHRQLAPSQWSPPRPACASSRVSVGFAYERPCMGCNEARSTPLDRSLSLARSLPSHVAWSSAVISDMLALRACVRACVRAFVCPCVCDMRKACTCM